MAKNTNKSFRFFRKISAISLAAMLACGLFLIAPQAAQAIQQCEINIGEFGDILTDDEFNWDEAHDCEQIATSFIEFEGGLTPPSGAGLAPTITQVRDLRTLVKNIANFALSFLGLTAVLIIIYGGFLFVTARGEEEQTTSGKKTITYALVGIVVILISFALVNTLITQAPTGCDEPGECPRGEEAGGTPAGDGKGDAGTGVGVSAGAGAAQGSLAQARLFNVAALEIQASLQGFLRAYDRMVKISDLLDSVKNLPPPRDSSDAQQLLRELQAALAQIRDATEPFSKTNVAAKRILKDFTEIWLRATDEELEGNLVISFLGQPQRTTFGQRVFAQTVGVGEGLRSASRSIRKGLQQADQTGSRRGRPTSFYESGEGLFHDDFRKAFDCPDCPEDQPGIEEAIKDDFLDHLSKTKDRLNIVKEGLGPLGTAPAGEFIQKGITSERELKLALAEIPPDMTIGDAFEKAEEALSGAEALVTDRDNVRLATDSAKKLAVLYTIVRDIKFMAVRINASSGQGNAPLSVQFTSVGSLDPSGQTITDEQHEWDLDGNGVADEEVNSLGCNEKAGAAATCVYELPGTYRVSLRMNPKGGVTNVASGIGIITLKVLPPKSRIDLEAQVADIAEVLHRFDDKGRITVNKNAFHVTLTEAKNGIRYDASKTTDGTGQPGGIANHKWTFGDGSNAIAGPSSNVIDNPKKIYNKTGTFPLQLEVTDKGGITDRKYINVVVSNIAARILALTFRGDLNKTFVFDGSRSTSDLGRIESYEWKIVDAKGNPVEGLQNNQSETFRYKFETAGKYTVKLKVANQSGDEAETSVTVFVESQAPTAAFAIRGCVKPGEPCVDSTQPSLVELDASQSFDPDTGDTVSYRWEVLPPADQNSYTVVEGALKDEPAEKTKKIRLKFNKTGTYKIRLTVEDQHKDVELRKSDSTEKEFFVGSVIDLSWNENMVSAMQLNDEGKAEFEFKANMKNATEYTINYGDGEEDTFQLEEGAESITVKHEYDAVGSFSATLKATDPENGQTTAQKRVYVSAADEPIAVISLKMNDQPVFFEEDSPIDPPLFRGVRVTFDASQSLNVDGTDDNLEYTWDFGDGEKSSSKTTIHTYENVSPTDPGYFEVSLTVKDTDSSRDGKSNARNVKIPVAGANPQIANLIVRKISQGEETPLDYEITAEGATDPDGNIVEFTFWYFDEDDPERKLGVVTTSQNHAILTLETKGEAGKEKRYSFCAAVKDNENNIAECSELFPDQETLPFATVINGPNQAPVANFTTDRTSLIVGGSVTFTSSSQDPDGRIEKYVWDVKGDGFHNDTETDRSQITQLYDEKSPTGGYKVKLKAIDDKGAAGFSPEISINVDLPFQPPTADFTYTPVGDGTRIEFKGVEGNLYSRVAPGSNATLTKFEWDFDKNKEFCTAGGINVCSTQKCSSAPKLCDHAADNDPDATMPNPAYEYQTSGQYEVRLTVEDSNGQKDDVFKIINVVRGQTPAAALTLEAKIATTPALGIENGRKVVHLHPFGGNYDEVEFRFGDSLGNIQRYVLDKNIYFDTANAAPLFPCPLAPAELQGGGDGCTDNDAEIDTPDGSQSYRVRYGRPGATEYTTYGPEYVTGDPTTRIFRARLTVFGKDEQNRDITDTDEIDIVFDPASAASQLGAFTIKKFGPQGAIMGGLLAGGLLAFVGYWLNVFFRTGKPRAIEAE